MVKLNNKFYARDPKVVAKELLGKILVRAVKGKILKARIVETEAYYDEKDPASRACQNGDLSKTMKMSAGIILVYGVHNNWLINFVTGNLGEASAVLIRALEPLNFEGSTKGPGLLTKSLQIDKNFHKNNLLDSDSIWVENCKNKTNFEIAESFRVGVKKDLPIKLRFYIKGNKWVSKK